MHQLRWGLWGCLWTRAKSHQLSGLKVLFQFWINLSHLNFFGWCRRLIVHS